MAALLNSLSFAFANSFLSKYRVKYCDYFVKWCSGVYRRVNLRLNPKQIDTKGFLTDSCRICHVK